MTKPEPWTRYKIQRRSDYGLSFYDLFNHIRVYTPLKIVAVNSIFKWVLCYVEYGSKQVLLVLQNALKSC